MPHAEATSPMNCVSGPLAAVETDLLVIPWFEDDPPEAVTDLDRATGHEVSRALASREFTGKRFDLFLAPVTDWRSARVILVGCGKQAECDADVLRKVAAASGLTARQRRIARVGFLLRGRGDLAELAQAAAEGLTLSEYDVGAYKTCEPGPAGAPSWTIATNEAAVDAPSRVSAAIARGRLLAECSNLARGLANEPGNTLTPREFARRATAIAAEGGIAVEVLDEDGIAGLGMGMLLGVARGSDEPPRLMVFRHDPPGAPAYPVLGLIGKGVTFDTGGISIKPAEGMERMKDDMAGGAAVACAMRAIGLLGAPIRVIGVVPATENMPGGRAIKPGDILTSAEGKTVEVINTDAEGRLILGDALWYARRLGATHLVDVATLTGAVVVALGKTTSGLFGTPAAWVEQVRRTAVRAGDRAWPMPIFDDYRDQLKSEIADFTNTGGRPAGSITAALFLKEFTGGLPWVHMDIAGTAWAEDAKPYLPKGPSGVAVRTLAELAFTSADWKLD
jgi:leucyl aminopeptidase